MMNQLIFLPVRYLRYRAAKQRWYAGIVLVTSCSVLLISVELPVHATTVIGPIYEIKEPSALDQIQGKLKAMEQSGELAKKQNELIERSKQSVLEPTPVKLPTVKSSRTYYYDPTFVLKQDLSDGFGRRFHKAGERINPFDYVVFSKHWLFINGKDPQQVKLAQDLYARYDSKLKLVLTNGRPLDLAKNLKFPVYFDQSGVFTQKLGIKGVPALVSQEGKKFRIDEIAP